MQAKDIILSTLNTSDMITKAYLKDLSDADFMIRPVPSMNTIAWQIGHLISSEHNFMELIKPGSTPALPEEFAAHHSKEAAASDDASKFLTKEEYLQLWTTQRNATIALLHTLSDTDLDQVPANTYNGMCPTVGHMINLSGTHALMHVGQYVPVRRMAGKPVAL